MSTSNTYYTHVYDNIMLFPLAYKPVAMDQHIFVFLFYLQSNLSNPDNRQGIRDMCYKHACIPYFSCLNK